MNGYLLLVAVVLFTCLVVVTSISVRRSSISVFELSRRKKAGKHMDEVEMLRENTYLDIMALKRVLEATLLVFVTLALIGGLGWLVGTVVALIIAIEFGVVADARFVRVNVQRLYDAYELLILGFTRSHEDVFRWIRRAAPESHMPGISSKEEVAHVLSKTEGVLSDEEKSLIIASLGFNDTLVRDVMTPRSVVETIKKGEILGPLVLDDLHKTGHSRFPVIEDDIDHVVGVLHIKDIMTLDTTRKHTAKVESAMSKQVFYIHEEQNLSEALSAFLSTHHHLFVVINEFRETVGILTLEDTVETLLGRTIVDEFDTHDDMRAVAARKASSAKSINRPAGSKDV